MGYYKMTRNRYETEIEALVVREEKRLAVRKAEQQARRDAWKSKLTEKVCPAHDGKTLCISANCLGNTCAQLSKIGLDANGMPLRKRSRPKCGAKTRKGTPCLMRVEAGMPRCRLHGGLSTGPKTKEGRERIAAGQKRRWAAYRIKLQIVEV